MVLKNKIVQTLCHGFMLSKWNDYFRVTFDHFWSKWQFLRQYEAIVKIGLSLKLNHYYQVKISLACPNPWQTMYTTYRVFYNSTYQMEEWKTIILIAHWLPKYVNDTSGFVVAVVSHSTRELFKNHWSNSLFLSYLPF